MTRRIAFFLLLITIVFSTVGFSCTLLPGNDGSAELAKPVTLNYWRVFDNQDTMDDIISAYQKAHPNVSINYRKFRYEEYEKELLDAFAEDRAPDIVSLHNDWMDKYLPKLQPIPASMPVGFLVEKGLVKKQTVTEARTVAGFTPQYVKANFLDTVESDVIRTVGGTEQVFGLPLAVDVLALYYNRDLLNNAGLIDAPTTWPQFEDAVNRLTVRDKQSDELIQSGAAFGGSANVERSFDILSTLMMQNGAQMSMPGTATFERVPGELSDRNIFPGVDALRFYTDYASPIKQAYTWNEDMPNSLEAFMQGRTAFYFGYSYAVAALQARAPRLRFGVLPIPQVDGAHPAVAANYWVETVTKKSAHANYAWDFLQFAAQAQAARSYLQKTGKPTALRGLIAEQKASEAMRPFASQLLYAKTWYHGKTPAVAEQAFQEMIHQAIILRGGSAQEELDKLNNLVHRAASIIQAEY